ncbi:flavodoxin family protein [Halomonas litopenaei]|nr:flavodoxin family protein [Halomonas litopenaei]
MNVLIVHCHPEPQSLNGALTVITADTLISQGHRVVISDLYAEGFDAIEHPRHYRNRQDSQVFNALTEQRHAFEGGQLPDDVAREIQRLEQAELVIFQFPLWWHGPPAMLKGWFDRVMVYGGMYSGSRRYDHGRLKGKRAICAMTTGSPAEAFEPAGRAGDIVRLMYPFHCSLYYLGLEVLPPQLAFGIQGGGLAYQEETAFCRHLESTKADWRARLKGLEGESTIPFSGWDDWDEQGRLGLRHPLRWR